MMGRKQMILTTVLWSLVVAAMLVFVATRTILNRAEARSSARIAESENATGRKFEPLFDAPPFVLTDQNGRPYWAMSVDLETAPEEAAHKAKFRFRCVRLID